MLEPSGPQARRRRRIWWCRGPLHGEPGGEPPLRAGVSVVLAEAATALTTVLIDDAHLVDDDTIARLSVLAARRHELDLRVVASRRPVRASRRCWPARTLPSSVRRRRSRRLPGER